MRIVSLLPAATEIVAALGRAGELAGISHECDFPAEVTRLPRVTRCLFDAAGLTSEQIDRRVAETLAANGTLYALDETLLRELAPEVILTQQLCDVCAVGYGSVARLASSLPGPPRVVNLEPSSLADVFRNVSEVAQAIGAPAEGLVAELERRVEKVRTCARAATSRARCFLVEWIDPPYSAGHWNPELVEIAGGVEVLGRAGEKSARVEWQKVLEARPEVIVVSCCGCSVERMQRDMAILQRNPGWDELPAVRAERVHLLDGNAYFTRPGPRLIDGLERLAGILHPEIFPEFVFPPQIA